MKVKCDNKKINLEEAESYVKQKPNKHILMFFRFHLMVYNIAHLGKERKWKTKLGTLWVRNRLFLIRQKLINHANKSIIFKNKGYYNAHVIDSIQLKRKRANITYTIKSGTPYRIIKLHTILKIVAYTISLFRIQLLLF